MKKTVLSLVLALLMVLPMLASCSSGNSGTQTSDSTTAPQIDPDTQAIDDYVAGIAENVNFSGETFTYIGRQSDNFPVEYEETGNLLSDAVYKRQRELEDIFGIKFYTFKINVNIVFGALFYIFLISYNDINLTRFEIFQEYTCFVWGVNNL